MTTQFQELTKVVSVLEEAVAESQGFKAQVEAALAKLTSREAEISTTFEKQKGEHQAELSRYQDEVRALKGTVTERVTVMEDSVHRLIARFEETRQQLDERLTRESVQALQRLDEQAHEQLRRQAETMHHVEDVLERRLLETLEPRMLEQLELGRARLEAHLNDRATEIGHRIGESFREAETQARARLEAFQGELHRTIVAELDGQRRHVLQSLTDLERAQREAEARLEATRAAAEATELRMRGYVDWFEGLMARPWYARVWGFVRGNRGR